MEITQKLGFDASQALATLDKLDKSLDRLNKSLGHDAASLKKFNSSSGNASKALAKLSTGAHQTGKAFNTGMGAAVQSTHQLTTSLQLLSRVVFTQAIVRGLSVMRQHFERTATAAAEFQRQVALISTIDDSGTSFSRIANDVRELSDSLNLPLLDTAAGVYQAISNQVGDFGESLRFAETSARFAHATNSSLADSVDLLSGALKSFGLDASQAERVAGIMFTTIDKGRISADELSNAFGRLGPIASASGLSLEEISAGLAAISVRGTNTSESITQLRATISAFLKPSVAMRRELDRLGFTSGDAALRTLGLGGALREVTSAAGGSQSRLAALLPNIRGLAGATALTIDGLQEFTQDLEAAEKAGTNFAKSKFAKVASTDAHKLTSEINKLSNALTVDFGQALLRTGVQVTDFFGGVDQFVSVMRQGERAIMAAVTSLTLMKSSIILTQAGMRQFGRQVELMSLTLGAAALGDVIGRSLDYQISRSINAATHALEQANRLDHTSFTEAQDAKVQTARELLGREIKLIHSRNEQARRLYGQDLSAIRARNEAMVASTTTALGRVLNARQALADRLAEVAADARGMASSSRDRVVGLGLTADQRAFDRAVRGTNEQTGALQRLGRAFKLAEEAAKKLRNATDHTQVSEALGQFGEANRLAESADLIAQRTGNRELEARAAGTMNKLLNEQLYAERELQRLAEQREVAAEKARATQQKSVDELRESIAVLMNNVSQFDPQGNLISDNSEARQTALKRIAELALSQNDLNAAGALGIADFVNRNLGDLKPVDLNLRIENGIKKIQNDLQKAFETFKLQVNVEPLEKLLGRQFTSPDDFAAGLSEAEKMSNDASAALAESRKAADEILRLRGELASIFTTLDQPSGLVQQFFADQSTANALLQIRSLADEVERLGESSNVTKAQVRETFADLSQLWDSLGPVDSRLLSDELAQVAAAIGKVNQIAQAQESAQATSRLGAELWRINQAIDAAQSSAAGFAGQLERAAAAASRIGVPGAMQGFANGGQVRGMDTVSVMARPGEFIMNPRSTQRFFSQIQAINAGQQPVYRQQGGSVTNVTVGDINVDGASAPQETARAVWAKIRREARRGTI